MSRKKIITAVLGLPVRKTNSQLEFFLTKRYAPQSPSIHNRWQLAGGSVDFGETPEETVIREFQEELDIIPTLLYPFPIVKTNTYHKGNNNTRNPVHLILLAYVLSIGNQVPHIIDPDEETNDMGWFNYEQILQLESLPKTVEYVDTTITLIKNDKIVV